MNAIRNIDSSETKTYRYRMMIVKRKMLKRQIVLTLKLCATQLMRQPKFLKLNLWTSINFSSTTVNQSNVLRFLFLLLLLFLLQTVKREYTHMLI